MNSLNKTKSSFSGAKTHEFDQIGTSQRSIDKSRMSLGGRRPTDSDRMSCLDMVAQENVDLEQLERLMKNSNSLDTKY